MLTRWTVSFASIKDARRCLDEDVAAENGAVDQRKLRVFADFRYFLVCIEAGTHDPDFIFGRLTGAEQSLIFRRLWQLKILVDLLAVNPIRRYFALHH